MNAEPDSEKHLAELMHSAQEGDAGAYATLLRIVTPLLRKAIRSQYRYRRHHDIEDVVQDTLLSVHVARATYDPERPFMPWLMAIARNRAADAARRQTRRARRETRVAHLEETFSDPGTNRLLDGYGDAEALRRAVGGLPDSQRRAVELLKLQEMSLKEAAAASGMTISALKVASHRAMGALRKVLADRG